jgi:dTMP kinase
MNSLKHGILIACEGIDGSGKTTLVKNLLIAFQERGLPIVATREPGATPLGAVLRTLVQEKKVAMCPKAEYLLFASDRAQHFHEVIKPNIAAGKMVISDRMSDSSLVYQGFGRGTSLEVIEYINRWTMDDIKPDVTLYVRIDLATAQERIVKRNEALTSYEKEKEAFSARLINGFDTLYANRSDVITLDGAQTPEQVAKEATEKLAAWMSYHGFIQ